MNLLCTLSYRNPPYGSLSPLANTPNKEAIRIQIYFGWKKTIYQEMQNDTKPPSRLTNKETYFES